MQGAICLNQEDLKMSVCSNFVEHIWKPGSCKNCFYPKHSHGQQTSLQLEASSVPLRNLNGIRNRTEERPLEDESVIASPYSKPTIAVKPTMINPDVSDVWADVNMNADISQVSWRMASENHFLVKPGEAQRTCLDNFNTSAMRKPFMPNTLNDCAPQYLHGYSGGGLACLESRAERNISLSSSVFEEEMDGWEERNVLQNKEKFTFRHRSFRHRSTTFADRSTVSSTDSPGCPAFLQREGTTLSSASSDNCCSPGFESESGEYCSIAPYCGESTTVPLDSPSLESRVAWQNSENLAPRSWVEQDTAVNPRAKTRAVKFCEDECRLVNSDSSFQRKHCLQDSPRNNAHSERKKLALISGATTLSDSVFSSSSSSSSSSPFALPQENDYCPLIEQSDLNRDDNVENMSKTRTALPAPHHTAPACSEPIYAESTKRKKVPPNSSGTQPKRDGLAISAPREQAPGMWCDGMRNLSNEREPQDPATQIAAKITVMAAHTEDDHRTIFLSSPDSAVGVQWPCSSPTSQSDFGIPSPSFGHREGSQTGSEMGSNESSPRFPQRSQGLVRESSAGAPKGSDSTPPASEGTRMPSVSSPVAGRCDRHGHIDNSTHFSSRKCTDASASEALPPPCSHTNRDSADEPNRGPLGSAYERRHKYCSATWNRQCRIEEEEEEEQGFFTCAQAREVENGPAGPHHAEDCSVQAKKAGMSKSASFAFDFPKDKKETEEFAPPPPPPKKQPRHALKMKKSSSELEEVSNDSAESLSLPFRGMHSSFVAGSTDSLNSDTRTASDGGSIQDRPQGPPSQPPPLPQKKTVSRTVSSPDGFFWGHPSPGRPANPTSTRLNISHSDSNVCVQKGSSFSCSSHMGSNQHTFSSSESLENACKGNGPWGPTLKTSTSIQNRNVPPFSASQLSVASQVSSVSSLQLHNLLSNIDSKEGVYAKLGRLYAESLRRLVTKCEDCFMHDQKNELHFNENNWSLFKLKCNKPCCDAGDAIYYCATCSKDPSSNYAVKICKTQESKMSASYPSPCVPVHFNIQQDCGHFVASVPSSMLLCSDVANSTSPPDGPGLSRSVSECDCVVVITREVPHQTTADFVRGATTYHQTKPELYERRVCFLLLQLCHGLEHLKEHGIIHRDLCLENLLLVHCRPLTGCNKTKDEKHLPRLIVSNFLKAKQKQGAMDSKLKKSQARLAPEIVSASQYRKVDEFQTGILIYELLHQPNPFEVRAHLREQEYSQDDLPPLPNLSIYSRGLQQLAHLLLEADPIKRIRITEAKRMLQCLLWGPRKDLTDQPQNHEEALHSTLQNWIDMKRALLMMKFAERAVDPERSVELEDWLCCQYLASADPASLSNTLKLLQLL